MKEVTIISKVVGRNYTGKNIPAGSVGSMQPVDLSPYMLKDIWDRCFELKETEDGKSYIFGKLPFVLDKGITLYADVENLDLPSIYDGLPIDGKTIYWENGILKAQGGGNEGINEEQLEEYLTNKNYAKKSDIPSIPTALKSPYALSWSGFNSESYDGSAAKDLYIPSKLSELTNDSGFITSSALSGYLPLSGGTINSGTTIPIKINSTTAYTIIGLKSNNNYVADVGYFNGRGAMLRNRKNNTDNYISINDDGTPTYNNNTLIHSGNIGSQKVNEAVLLSGTYQETVTSGGGTGTMKYSYAIPRATEGLFPWYDNSNSVLTINRHGRDFWSQLGFSSNGNIYYRHTNGSPLNTTDPWKALAFTDSNVASATKLQTARTIWGQSFDGTGNVSGNLHLNISSIYWWGDAVHYCISSVPQENSSPYLKIAHYGGISFNTDVYERMRIASSGNVGIGTTTPAYKLDVSGTFRASGAAVLGSSLSVAGSASFTGEVSLSNDMYISSEKLIKSIDTDGNVVSLLSFSSLNNLNLGYGMAALGHATYVNGNVIGLRYGKTHLAGLYINSSGLVGIGTEAPSYKLHVAGSGYFSEALTVVGVSSFAGKTAHNGGISATSGTFSSTLAVTSTSVLAGGATIGKSSADNGTYKLHVTGSAYISSNLLTGGSITMYSMRSMKNIINEKGLSLEELSTIKPTRFTWKDGRDDRIQVGGIADDVMKVLPEVVFKGSDGVLSMDYASASFVMAASLIQPMTEHERRIANLERENVLLKKEIERLKSA